MFLMQRLKMKEPPRLDVSSCYKLTSFWMPTDKWDSQKAILFQTVITVYTDS